VRQKLNNAGNANQKERLNYMIKLKLIILFTMLTIVSGCSEFALLASGSSIAVSQNAYVKAYNGVDVLTIMNTDKDIKRHLYDQIKDKD
jgi:hypothetical protein